MLEEISETTTPSRMAGAAVPATAPVRRGRQAQAAVATLFLVNGAAVGSWVPHIPERTRALHLNVAQLGSVLLAAGIGALCAMPLSAPLVRRYGSKSIALTSGLVFPALLTIAILLPSVRLLVGFLFLTGFAASTMDVSMNTHGVLLEKVFQKRMVSFFHAVFSVGCFAGAGIQSVLMSQHVPDKYLVPSFGICLLALVVASSPFLLPQATEQAQHTDEHDAAPAGPVRHGWRALLPARLPHPRLLLLGTLCFSAMVCEGAMGDWSALLLRVVHHLPSGAAGYGYTCFAGFMVLGRFLGDNLVARIGELWALRLGGLVSAGGMLLILLAAPFPLLLIGFALAGVGLANASPVLYRTAGTMPGFAPGEGLSTAVGVGYAGLLVGPPLLGLLAHRAGLPSIFWVLFSLSIVLVLAAKLVQTGRAARFSGEVPELT